MRYLEHFITSIDYDKLIKMQANRVVPYQKAADIRKNVKNIKTSSPKVKSIGRRR